MKKFILMMVMMFTMTVGALAQYGNSNFTDNWSVGVNGGVNTPLDFNDVFPLNPNAGLFVQKAVTPGLALRVEGTALFGSYNSGEVTYFPLTVSETFVKATNVGVSTVWNLTNIFNGYTGTPRNFEVSAVTGLGWMYTFNNGEGNANDLSAKTGLDFAFNVGSNKAWQVYVEPAVLWNLTETGGTMPKFNKQFAQLGVNVGLVYKFKTSNGTHNFVKIRPYDDVEVARLNGRIEELEKLLKSRPQHLQRPQRPVAPQAPAVKEVVKEVAHTANVWFEVNSAELSDEAKAALDKVTGEVTVEGYASVDGPRDYNQTLSEKRAQAVAEYLKSRGVTVKEAVGKGVPKAAFNRVAVVK